MASVSDRSDARNGVRLNRGLLVENVQRRQLIFHFAERRQHRFPVRRGGLVVRRERLLFDRAAPSRVEDVDERKGTRRPEIAGRRTWNIATMTAMSMPSCNELSAIDDIYHSYNERRRSSRNVAGIRKDSDHHNVYVVYLRNPKKDGRAGYYVGMTGLSPERRFENHKNGVKAARVVKRCGERLVPKLYAHLNPMPYAKAKEMEVFLADSLRKRGYVVYGGH